MSVELLDRPLRAETHLRAGDKPYNAKSPGKRWCWKGNLMEENWEKYEVHLLGALWTLPFFFYQNEQTVEALPCISSWMVSTICTAAAGCTRLHYLLCQIWIEDFIWVPILNLTLPKPSEKLAPMTWRSTDQLPQASNTASVLWQSHCHLVVTSCYQKLSTIPKVVCQMQQCCAVPHGRKLCAICYCKLLSKHQIHFTPILQCCLVQSK